MNTPRFCALLMLWVVFSCTPEDTLLDAPPCQTYVRESFLYGIDADKDCQYTRAERLIELSRKPVTYLNSKQCSVDSGEWYDPYSGQTFVDASDLEIDHIVPLSEAFQSGAWAWSSEEKMTFSNDTLNLMPVKGALNQAKSDQDPSEWLPPNVSYQVSYVRRYVQVKKKYHLAFDAREMEAILAVDPGMAPDSIADEYTCLKPAS